MVNRGAGYIPSSEDIVFYRRKHMSLHHGYVFVCGGMVDDRRSIAFHRLLYIAMAGDVAQLGEEGQPGKLVVQLSVQLKQRSFGLVKANQGKRVKSGYLAADLRTDRARRAGYH